jgi:hypothetical protein
LETSSASLNLIRLLDFLVKGNGSFCRIIHLTVILRYYILLQLADSAKKADATEFMQLIKQTEDVLEGNRRNKRIAGGHVSNGLLDIYDLENLVVVGDLHGDRKS